MDRFAAGRKMSFWTQRFVRNIGYVILPNKDISVHKPNSITNYARLLQKNSHEVDLLFKELKSEGLL